MIYIVVHIVSIVRNLFNFSSGHVQNDLIFIYSNIANVLTAMSDTTSLRPHWFSITESHSLSPVNLKLKAVTAFFEDFFILF